MRRVAKVGIFVGATAAVIVSGTLVSYASWVVPDPAATAKVQTPSMPGGPTPTSEISDGKAVVHWNAQNLAGVKMTAYVVTAHDTDETPLPSIARTVTASGSDDESAAFTGAELAGGKWKWAITPKLQSWTGTEGALSNPKLIFPAPSPANALAKVTPAKTGSEAVQAVETTPTPASTTEAPAEKPETRPAPSATEKATEKAPEKTESPKADPTPSDSPSVVDPSPAGSASE
jgi:hypothetical protein